MSSRSDDEGEVLQGDQAKKAEAAKKRRKRRLSVKAKASRQGQIDLATLLAEPLPVSKDGKVIDVNPLEAAIRAQVQKALLDRNFRSIKAVIDLAVEHRLIADSGPKQRGGVIRVPASIDRETYLRIFKARELSAEEILRVVEAHYEKD